MKYCQFSHILLLLVTGSSANEALRHQLNKNFRGAVERVLETKEAESHPSNPFASALDGFLEKRLADASANDEKDLNVDGKDLNADKNGKDKKADLDEVEELLDEAVDTAKALLDEAIDTAETADATKEKDLTDLAANVQADTDMAAVPNKERGESHADIKEALQMYFDSLQVVLGFADPPEDKALLHDMMTPFAKEVQWTLGAMHPGFDKDLVNDDVIMNRLANVVSRKKKASSEKDNNRRRNLVDTDVCLEKTRDILSISMRLAYYGLYGDLHSSDSMIQNSGKDIADQLDVEEARERLKELGPLKDGENEFKLIAREVFKFAENEVGLDGIINYGMKSWDQNNFWATGLFASELWSTSLQINQFDTFPISSQTFLNPDSSQQDTVREEFTKLVNSYNDHCATCPMGWTDNGISKHGLHCTTGYSPSCEEKCLQTQCNSVKGKWESVNLEFNPYTCYMSVCPTGWKSLGYKDKGLMCTMHRSHACDESCAEVQCKDLGGSFPLSIDDIADNPYVCYV